MKGEKSRNGKGPILSWPIGQGLIQGATRPDLGLASSLKRAGISEFQLARISLQAVLAKQTGFQLHALLHLAQEVASHHR